MKKIIYSVLLLVLGPFAYTQTGVVGDNLGNHKATQILNMNGNSIKNLTLSAELSPDTIMIIKSGITEKCPSDYYMSYVNSYISGFVHLSGNETIAGTKSFSSDLVVNNLNIGEGQFLTGQNTLMGYQALQNNVGGGSTGNSGQFNTAIGYQTLSKNTGIGNSAGAGNTAIGYQALFNNGSGSTIFQGNYNTAVGYLSGLNTAKGLQNTFIGYNSGKDIINGSYNTIIGGNAATGDVSNNVVLSDGAGNIKLQIDATGATTLNGALNKLNLVTGANKSTGTVTLSGGTVTVTTTAANAGSIILLTRMGINLSSALGVLSVTPAAGSFIINSYNSSGSLLAGDLSTIGWVIIN